MSRDSTVIPLRQPEAIAIPLMEAARAEAHRMLAPVLIAKAGAFMARWKDFSCRMVAIAGRDTATGRVGQSRPELGRPKVRRAKGRHRGEVSTEENPLHLVDPSEVGRRSKNLDALSTCAGSRRRFPGSGPSLDFIHNGERKDHCSCPHSGNDD
jgi:hypothetical protein